jgi:hypothetical protein
MQAVPNAVFISLDSSLAGDFLEFRAAAIKSTAGPVAVTKQPQRRIGGATLPSNNRPGTHILSALNGSSILTGGEMTQFVAHRGIVQFSIEGQPVHFEINLDAPSRARLEVSSKLLAFAQIVRSQCSESDVARANRSDLKFSLKLLALTNSARDERY